MAKYRLAALLKIRERAEEEAKQAFAEAQSVLRSEEEKLEEMVRELERMVEDRKARREEYSRRLAAGEMKVTEQSSAYRFIDRLKEKETEQKFEIEGQKETVREAEKALKRAQDALIHASQELKALEKHKENWAAKVKKERDLKEANQLDEIGQVIHGFKDK